jgi:hypothetical protein
MFKRRIWMFLAIFAGIFQMSVIKILAADPCLDTALGCVPYTVKGFSTWLMNILFGIAGGISFLLMIYGFILVGTSSGDDKKLQGAKETITSAITGLLVSIFALFIFRLIAVDILKIPGLSVRNETNLVVDKIVFKSLENKFIVC